MRIVNARDMHALPEGTIYCGTTGDTVGPEFHGYSEDLYRMGPFSGSRWGWWAAELLPQLPRGPDGKRTLEMLPDEYMLREPPHPSDNEEKWYYVFDPEDVAVLIRALGGISPASR